jgi:roadblock/LC7 domain-containing protein
VSTIPQWFVQQWDTAVRMEVSQKQSRLQKAVTDRGTITGEAFTINVMGDDGSKLAANSVRHGDTEWSLAAQSARVANMADFYEAVPLDRNDIPKMLVNPLTGGDYMNWLMAKKNRRIDDIIYTAARGSQLMKDGSSTALPAGQKVAAAATGFTKAKIINARKLFRTNEADNWAGEQLYLMYNGEMLEDILSDTTLTSADFMAVQMLQKGDVSTNWMGFEWIPYNGITLSGGSYFTVAWAKSGIHFGSGYVEGNISPRPDKKDAKQASLGCSFGAGRQDEKKVVEIAFV